MKQKKVNLWILYGLCKTGSTIFTVITLGIPSLIKWLNEKAETLKQEIELVQNDSDTTLEH